MTTHDIETIRKTALHCQELHTTATAKFQEAHATLTGVIQKQERLRAAATAAANEAGQHKIEWRQQFQDTNGELTTSIKKLRKLQRDNEELAEEYQVMLAQSEVARERAELSALDAAEEAEMARVRALIAIGDLEIRSALAKALPDLAKAYHIAAFSRTPWSRAEMMLAAETGFDAGQFVLNIIMQAIQEHARTLEADEVAIPDTLAQSLDIAPLLWADVQSPIKRRQRWRAIEQGA